MKRPKKIDAIDCPDVFLPNEKYGMDDVRPAVTVKNFEYLIEKHNELVDIINELMDKEG